MLAEQHGVSVEDIEDVSYSCIVHIASKPSVACDFRGDFQRLVFWCQIDFHAERIGFHADTQGPSKFR